MIKGRYQRILCLKTKSCFGGHLGFQIQMKKNSILGSIIFVVSFYEKATIHFLIGFNWNN